MNKKGIMPIIFGIIVFAARYIPAIHQKSFLLDNWFSISDYATGCNTLIGTFIENCEMIKTLDVVMIVLAVIFVVSGFYKLFKK